MRLLDRPFRMAISDFFKGGIGSSSGVSVAGRIDAGHVQVGEQVVAIPGGEMGVVKSKWCFIGALPLGYSLKLFPIIPLLIAMLVNDETANWGAAGDSCLMTLTGIDIMQLRYLRDER